MIFREPPRRHNSPFDSLSSHGFQQTSLSSASLFSFLPPLYFCFRPVCSRLPSPFPLILYWVYSVCPLFPPFPFLLLSRFPSPLPPLPFLSPPPPRPSFTASPTKPKDFRSSPQALPFSRSTSKTGGFAETPVR